MSNNIVSTCKRFSWAVFLCWSDNMICWFSPFFSSNFVQIFFSFFFFQTVFILSSDFHFVILFDQPFFFQCFQFFFCISIFFRSIFFLQIWFFLQIEISLIYNIVVNQMLYTYAEQWTFIQISKYESHQHEFDNVFCGRMLFIKCYAQTPDNEHPSK